MLAGAFWQAHRPSIHCGANSPADQFPLPSLGDPYAPHALGPCRCKSFVEKLRHDFGRDVVSCEDSLGASVGAGGKQNERSAARLRSEGEARPLHSLRQLPANASEGIPDAVRRPEAMTAASADGDRSNHVTHHIAGEVAERPSATRPCTWASQRPRGVDYAKQGRT